MYTRICRFFRILHQWPRTVLSFSFLITLLALGAALKLEIRFSLLDVLPDSFKSVEILQEVESRFGGLGKLSLIVSSPDPEQNKKAVQWIVEKLRSHPDINILDYKNEISFFKKNQLLYIDLPDLQRIEKRVENGLWAAKKSTNPILVDLLDEGQKAETEKENLSFEDLESKYFSNFNPYLSTPNEHALFIHLFPKFDISDVAACNRFFAQIKNLTAGYPDIKNVKLLYTGEVLSRIQNEGRLLSEVFQSGWVSFITIVVLLFIFFFRIPSGPLLFILPLTMGIIWTLALTYLFIGYLNMITLSLAIILLGLGLDAALHLLSRYGEERRKGFGAELAFETIILETGPAVSTGALTSAAAFFAITSTQFKGYSQFGLIAGMGMCCTLVAILLVFPCLLIVLESHGLVHVSGPKISNHKQFKRKPFIHWRLSAFLLLLLSLVFTHRGLQTSFQYNLEQLGFPNQNHLADSLMQVAGEAIAPPTVVLTNSLRESEQVANYVKTYKLSDTLTPTIHSVLSLPGLLPRHQTEKLKIITKLKRLLTPKVIQGSSGSVKINLEKLLAALDVSALTVADLPESFKKKFTGRDKRQDNFVFIFPAVDLKNGLNCMAFAHDTRRIQLDSNQIYYTSGKAVIYSELLKLMIPDTVHAILLALLTVAILIFLHTQTIRGTAVLLFPIILGLVWSAGIFKIFNLKISYFNLIIFPAMIGIGIDNGLHLYHRYLEEGTGSLYFVMRRTGSLILIGSITSMAGFFGMLLSPHRGLLGMGLAAVIGISLTLLATFLFVPFFLGVIDEKRWEPDR